MGRYYILRDGKVVEEPDYQTWASWYESVYEGVREVAQTDTAHSSVTTHFLAMSMTLAQDDPPMLFETRVKGGWLDGEWERFASPAEAKRGHDAWVEKVRAAEEENELPPPGAAW